MNQVVNKDLKKKILDFLIKEVKHLLKHRKVKRVTKVRIILIILLRKLVLEP